MSKKNKKLLKTKFKYSLIKDLSQTSSLKCIKKINITVSFFIQLTMFPCVNKLTHFDGAMKTGKILERYFPV